MADLLSIESLPIGLSMSDMAFKITVKSETGPVGSTIYVDFGLCGFSGLQYTICHG